MIGRIIFGTMWIMMWIFLFASGLGLIALLEFEPGLVMIAGLRKTKKSYIKNINARQPVDLLFHD